MEAVSQKAVEAVAALLDHEKKQRAERAKASAKSTEEAGEAATSVWITVSFTRITEDAPVKPLRLSIPVPWRSTGTNEAVPCAGFNRPGAVCLIVKDPQADYKKLVAELKNNGQDDHDLAVRDPRGRVIAKTAVVRHGALGRLRVEAAVSGDPAVDRRATEVEERLADLFASLPPAPYGAFGAVIARGV